MRRAVGSACIAWVSACLAPALAQQGTPGHDLADLTLEQLGSVLVTSASRREERLLGAPSSIYVIGADDIRRAGATTLAEAFTLAPNLQVVRGDNSQSIASARGGLFGTANKMLVLVDGRIVYTPLFSGVFSDAQDLVLGDIERIEVISGPGSTLWGMNAVNGVINVITRGAATTQGIRTTVLGGTDRREVTVRRGGRWDADAAYRLYAKYARFDENETATGAAARDAAERLLAGFRADVERGSDTRTVQAEVYKANVDNAGGARDVSGAYVRGRSAWRNEAGDDVSVQGYLERTERRHAGTFEEVRDTIHVDAQHSLRHGAGRFVWGADYRLSKDSTEPSPALAFRPAGRALRFASVYVQEEHHIGPSVKAIAGLRAERNDYTGVEWLPNVRVSWARTADSLLWAALTRSVRAPSRIERDLLVPGVSPSVITPNNSFLSEVAKVVELGWRERYQGGGWVSVTAFHHDFSRLRTLEPKDDGLLIANGGLGRVSGIEIWGEALVTRTLRIKPGMVLMRHRFELEPGRIDLDGAGLGNNPRRSVTVRASWNPKPGWEFDASLRHMGDLPQPKVGRYTLADVRLGWRAAPSLDLSVVVQNVFDRRHVEFGATGVGAVFGRHVLLSATWALF